MARHQGPARNRFYSLYENCPMRTVPREGLCREAIIRYDLKKDMSGSGIDYSTELTTPNDLPSLRNYYSQMSLVDDGVGRVLAALQQAGLYGGDAGDFHGRSRFFPGAQWLLGARAGYVAV